MTLTGFSYSEIDAIQSPFFGQIGYGRNHSNGKLRTIFRKLRDGHGEAKRRARKSYKAARRVWHRLGKG